jgi:hypothetical protein
MSDPQVTDRLWKAIWQKYHSEINIEVVHSLTEPVCPSAVVVIEHPREVLKDTRSSGDTIQEAVQRSYDKFIEIHLIEPEKG